MAADDRPDDMVDSQEELASLEKGLRDALQLCSEVIVKEFTGHDDQASKYQRRYHLWAKLAVWSGAGAVMLLIVHVVLHQAEIPPRVRPFATKIADLRLVPLLELLAGAISVFSVLWAQTWRLKETWLVERLKAEELRLLKFSSLMMNPKMARVAQHPELRGEVQLEVDEIEGMGFGAVEAWAALGAARRVRERRDGEGPQETPWSFVKYYRDKRLAAQLKYLARSAELARNRNTMTEILGPTAFFGSVAFVLAHVALRLIYPPGDETLAGRLLVLIAAALPAIGAALRTSRAVHESARNADRHEATLDSIGHMGRQIDLDEATKDDPRKLETSLRAIDLCEQVLEADAREWMRLMKGAEWFG